MAKVIKVKRIKLIQAIKEYTKELEGKKDELNMNHLEAVRKYEADLRHHVPDLKSFLKAQLELLKGRNPSTTNIRVAVDFLRTCYASTSVLHLDYPYIPHIPESQLNEVDFRIANALRDLAALEIAEDETITVSLDTGRDDVTWAIYLGLYP